MLAALVSLVWLAALALAGVAALSRLAPFLTPLERFAHGSVLGIVVGTLALLPLATLFALTVPVVLVTFVLAVAVGLAFWLRGRDRRAAVAALHPRLLLGRLDAGGTILFAFLALRWSLLWQSALQLRPDGLWAGHEYIWSDWPTHLGIVTRFAFGDNFPPQNTLYAGLPLSYHYLSDLTPAAMVTLGMDPIAALPFHSFVLSLIVALSLWAFVRRLAISPSIATLATFLFLFGAGLGWIATAGTLDQTHSLTTTLLQQPWDAQAQTALHIRFFNPYLAFLMSQRAYLYGLPIAMLMLTILVAAVRRRGLGRFVLAGIVGGFLPLSHLPTLLAMAMTTPFLVLLLTPQPWRDPLRRIPWTGWFVFHAVWIAVALPQLFTQLGGGTGALEAFRLQTGWVAAPDPWWWFWLKNLGLFIPLALVGLFAGRILPPRSNRVVWALMPIFAIANLAVFQPWDWDNHKILIYWFLGVTIVVAALLVHAWRRAVGRIPRVAGLPAELRGRVAELPGRTIELGGPVAEHGGRVRLDGPAIALRALLIVAVSTMVLGPLLENLDQLEGHMDYRMITSEQIQVAAEVRAISGPQDIVVTSMQPQDPVMMLSGRQLLMGYWGQLWVSGIPYQQRQAEVQAIYQLTPAGLDALRRDHVAFVVVGPDARAKLGAVDAAWMARFPVAAGTTNYRIYDVRGFTRS